MIDPASRAWSERRDTLAALASFDPNRVVVTFVEVQQTHFGAYHSFQVEVDDHPVYRVVVSPDGVVTRERWAVRS